MSDALRRPSAPHPMDRIYGRQRHIYDASRKFFLLGRDRLVSELRPPAGGTVLEIGCGTGRNLVAAARACRDAHFFGLDVSSAMLTTARLAIKRAGLEERVHLARGDAACFHADSAFGRRTFDRVFFSYSLSMIPAWREALRQALAATDPAGGALLVVDFGDQRGLPGWFSSALSAWLAKFHVSPRQDLHPELAALASAGGGTLAFRSLYRDYACFAQLSF